MNVNTYTEDRLRQYRIRPGYVLRCLVDEYIAVPVALQDDDASQVAVMNESGKFLWEQLKTPMTIDALVSAMTDAYEVSRTEAEDDIRAFLGYLEEHHLIDIDMEEMR